MKALTDNTVSGPTPGPWQARAVRYGYEWEVIKQNSYEPNPADPWFVALCYDMADGGCAEANARLIAAAPALLEGCIEAEKVFRWYGDLHAAKPDAAKAKRNYDMADELAAIIALAKGGEA